MFTFLPSLLLLMRAWIKINQYLKERKTVIVLSSSGVGKSTLMNAISGTEEKKTGHIREDDRKGKHSTTVRNLRSFPSVCSLIDIPCLRKIRVWTVADQMSDVCGDFLEVASRRKFLTVLNNVS